MRAITCLIQYQGIGDLYRIYSISQRDGVDFNLAYIPSTFTTPHTAEFDPAHMQELFEFGHGMAEAAYPWAKRPPILVSGEADLTLLRLERRLVRAVVRRQRRGLHDRPRTLSP